MIVPQRRGHQGQDLIEHDIQINLPRYLPTGRYPREPPIDEASDLPIEIQADQAIPGPIDFQEDKTKTRPTDPKLSLSRYPNRNPSRSLL